MNEIHDITVYGPPICYKCMFTIKKFQRAGIEVQKAIVEDKFDDAILAAKLAIKAQQLSQSIDEVAPLTDEERSAPHAAPFVFINGAFAWNDLDIAQIERLIASCSSSLVAVDG